MGCCRWRANPESLPWCLQFYYRATQLC